MDWQTGGTIVAVVAVAYGLGLGFMPKQTAPQTKQKIVMGGALLLLALAVVLVLLPLLGVY